ncbi:MAG: uracil-DNA glycosylase [Rhodospirillales bacterium]|jgi:DNA polymerase|nr:uracil-DNA glycosylase [Rhodospirillales bacterium]
MDAWAALRLQIEFGADEALEEVAPDRVRRAPGAGDPPDAGATADAAPHASEARPLRRPPSADGPVQAPAPAPALHRAPGAAIGAGAASVAALAAADLAAAADSLAALRAAIAGFDGCPLRATAANLVFAEGPPEAELLLIGEAPTDADDRAGRPFTGPAGAYLDKMLASIGLDRAQLLLAPLVPWRPPGDRPPSPGERAACRPFLHRLIALARPRRVLLLGALAAQDLLGSGAGRRGGGWRLMPVPSLEPLPALASQSPGFLLRNPGPARRRAWADLRLLRRTLDEDFTKS